MKITDGLLGEHALFYQIFDSLEEVMDEAASPIEIQRAFDAIRLAILSHAALEDEVLFANVARSGAEAGIISVMRAEHREIDGLTNAVARAGTLEEARGAARRLLDLLRVSQHRCAKIFVWPGLRQ